MKLSKAQQRVIDDLENGLYIWTNEGKGMRCWIGGESADKAKTLNIRTVNRLHELDLIKFVDGDYPGSLFKYELSKKSKIK